MMKLFRHPEPGLNPDCEIGRFLTEETRFKNIPPFGGSIEYINQADAPTTLCMLQGLVANQGDGWQWMLEELERYYENYAQEIVPTDEWARLVASTSAPLGTVRCSDFAREHAGVALEAAAVLGRRTAEMHRALASSKANTAFSPEPLSREYVENLQASINTQAAQAYDLLRKTMSDLADDTVEIAALLLSHRSRILDSLGATNIGSIDGQRTRIHGDYHLGQVLRVKADFVILDFEGEPARSLEVRRMKHSPLKDVAGMLRSFNYAAWAALMKYSSRRPEDQSRLEPWARLWDLSASAEFLYAYMGTMTGSSLIPASPSAQWSLLDLYLLEKAFYELVYELNSRPDWVKIPLMGVAALLRQEF
jgi:maltose alpha-D-glucosyltransferase / alpha-amylase